MRPPVLRTGPVGVLRGSLTWLRTHFGYDLYDRLVMGRINCGTIMPSLTAVSLRVEKPLSRQPNRSPELRYFFAHFKCYSALCDKHKNGERDFKLCFKGVLNIAAWFSAMKQAERRNTIALFWCCYFCSLLCNVLENLKYDSNLWFFSNHRMLW